MKNVVKNVIEAGRFELNDVLRKISSLWVQGMLSGEEMAELTMFAREKADAAASVNVLAKLADLEQRIVALENASGDTESGEGEDSVNAEEYVEGKWYYAGDVVTFGGKTYTCVAPEETVCVWSPEAYPAYWALAE